MIIFMTIIFYKFIDLKMQNHAMITTTLFFIYSVYISIEDSLSTNDLYDNFGY